MEFHPEWEKDHPSLAALWKKLLHSPHQRLIAKAEPITLLLEKDGSWLRLQWGEMPVEHLPHRLPLIATGPNMLQLSLNSRKMGLLIEIIPLERWQGHIIIGKMVVAMRQAGTLTGCDIEGNTHAIPFVEEQWANLICIKNGEHGLLYDVAVVNTDLFSRLCQSLKQQNTSRFYVSEIRVGEVLLQEKEHTFTVELRAGRWHCENRQCPSENHYACSHARYVHAIIPVEAVRVRRYDGSQS